MSGLTAFQSEVARVLFSLPASEGFLLAGGGALLASGLTSRPTIDLDFFGDRQRVDVADAANQFESLMRTLDRFDDDELPVDAAEVVALRSYFAAWAEELRGSTK